MPRTGTPNVDENGRGLPPSKPEHFKAFADEHLDYEVMMLCDTFALLSMLRNFENPRVRLAIKNLCVESLAMHSRLLHEFLDGKGGFKTDAKAKHFRTGNAPQTVPQSTRLTGGRVAARTGFSIDRADKEIVHLSYLRHYGAAPAKEWNVRTYVPSLREEFEVFLDGATETLLDPSTKKRIQGRFAAVLGEREEE